MKGDEGWLKIHAQTIFLERDEEALGRGNKPIAICLMVIEDHVLKQLGLAAHMDEHRESDGVEHFRVQTVMDEDHVRAGRRSRIVHRLLEQRRITGRARQDQLPILEMNRTRGEARLLVRHHAAPQYRA